MIAQRVLRQRRLEIEYDKLMKISGDVIKIEPLGNAPYEKYRVTFNLKTIISPIPEFRNQTVCIFTIPTGYPAEVPKIVVESTSMPPPWHPNCYKSGTVSLGGWNKEESLVNYLYRCARIFQFAPEMTNPNDPANKDAVEFWNANKNNHKLIPCDKQVSPTLDETIKLQIEN